MTPENSPIKPASLFEDLKSSEHGRELNMRPRYDKFLPEGLSHEAWATLLGPDVDNLTHMSHSVHIATVYEILSEGDETSREVPPEWEGYSYFEVLKIAAVVHDIQEAVVGDTNFHDKTEESEKEEEDEFVISMSNVFPNQFTPEQISNLQTIVFHQDTQLGLDFRMVEQMGYMTTALTAATIAQDPQGYFFSLFKKEYCSEMSSDQEGQILSSLTDLAANVFATQVPRLVPYMETNIAVKRFLTNVRPEIQAFVDQLSDHPEMLPSNGNTWDAFLGALGQIPHPQETTAP